MTTKKKISQAFATLHKDGYFARQNFQCCQTCGWAAVPHDKAKRAVFYHAQDADNLKETGTCHLAWDGDGEQIVKHLTAAGLKVEWDGSEGHRMFVCTPETTMQ
jgi:hypothetical protein